MKAFNVALKDLDIKLYLKRSNRQAFWMLTVNYLILTFAFALVIYSPHAVTVLLSLILLGNRQLGLGILMHDCVHKSLFKTPKLNNWVGKYLCAAPILAQFEGYRTYHLKHHAKAGSTEDPDYANYKDYPVSRVRLLRKLARDCIGMTGLKNVVLLMLMHAGVLHYDMAYKNTDKQKVSLPVALKNLCIQLWPSVVFHLFLSTVLVVNGHGWAYWLWWAAYFTTFQLFSRIRNAAEHAGVKNLLSDDPRLHARTVYAGMLARLTVAPNHVNYHVEHHWLPSVPPYRLSAFHNDLKHKGLLDTSNLEYGYSDVIRALYHA